MVHHIKNTEFWILLAHSSLFKTVVAVVEQAGRSKRVYQFSDRENAPIGGVKDGEKSSALRMKGNDGWKLVILLFMMRGIFLIACRKNTSPIQQWPASICRWGWPRAHVTGQDGNLGCPKCTSTKPMAQSTSPWLEESHHDDELRLASGTILRKATRRIDKARCFGTSGGGEPQLYMVLVKNASKMRRIIWEVLEPSWRQTRHQTPLFTKYMLP